MKWNQNSSQSQNLLIDPETKFQKGLKVSQIKTHGGRLFYNTLFTYFNIKKQIPLKEFSTRKFFWEI
jgi:hypothetical protein